MLGRLVVSIKEYLQKSASVIEASMQPDVMAQADNAIEAIAKAFKAGKPLLVCGNGGSAADAMHIAGEFVGRFLKERKAQKCIALSSNPATLTAWANDYSFDTVFSRQVEAYGEQGGVVWGISTSGNSANVLKAFAQAKAMGMTTIGLTGQGGGKMAPCSDILIAAASRETPFIQQVHLCIYHYICQMVEEAIV